MAASLLLLVIVARGDVHLSEDPLEAVGDGVILRGLHARQGPPAGVAAVRVRVLDQGAPVLVLRYMYFGFRTLV